MSFWKRLFGSEAKEKSIGALTIDIDSAPAEAAVDRLTRKVTQTEVAIDRLSRKARALKKLTAHGKASSKSKSRSQKKPTRKRTRK